MADRPRLYFLDNLRAVVILLVVLLHASITYMAYAPEWWYVLDPDQGIGWTMLVLLVDVPNMQALFFVAGFLALPSLARRGTGGFVREKLIRLGVPWVFGVVVLAPLITYMIFISRGIERPYLEFWAGDFWGAWFQQAVYWFLGALLVLFLLLAWAWAASERLRASTRPGDSAARAAVRGLRAAHGGGLRAGLAGRRARRLEAVRVVPRGPAGPDRVLRRVLRARRLRGAPRLADRGGLPAGGRAVGRGRPAHRRRVPRVPARRVPGHRSSSGRSRRCCSPPSA